MKMIIISLWVLSLTMIIWQAAVAQDPDVTKQMEKAARQAYKDLLKETDKDKDGKISKKEFYAIWKDKKPLKKNTPSGMPIKMAISRRQSM